MSKTNVTKIDPSAMQDAFHYALAACGGSALGYESSFAGEIGKGQRHVANRNNTRSNYLRLAFKEARQAFGHSFPDIPRKLPFAKVLAKRILDEGKRAGYDANGGVRLCSACNNEQAEHGSDGLCYRCFRAEASAAFAPKPLPAIPPVSVQLTGVDIATLLDALDRHMSVLAAEGFASKTPAARADEIEIKLGECQALRDKLCAAIVMPGCDATPDPNSEESWQEWCTALNEPHEPNAAEEAMAGMALGREP